MWRYDYAGLAARAAQAANALAYLAPRILKWWTPDDVVFAAVPLTATGKIDKKALRQTWGRHLMG